MGLLIISLSCLAFVCLIAWIFKQPAVKGKCGELFVAWVLKKRLDKNVYRILNDVMIPDSAGGTTQIDHIVLSPYGIFVIETKNMKGWIFGDRNSDKWMQQIYRCKNQFQNPFRQNYKHIVSLAELIGLPVDSMQHIIVFLGFCTLKTRDKLPESLVTNASELFAYINTFEQAKFNDETLDHIQSILLESRLKNTHINRREHIEYVSGIANSKNSSAAVSEPSAGDFAVVCPSCGAPMILRQANRGGNAGKKFWGCSNYPKCRHIINTEE